MMLPDSAISVAFLRRLSLYRYCQYCAIRFGLYPAVCRAEEGFLFRDGDKPLAYAHCRHLAREEFMRTGSG